MMTEGGDGAQHPELARPDRRVLTRLCLCSFALLSLLLFPLLHLQGEHGRVRLAYGSNTCSVGSYVTKIVV